MFIAIKAHSFSAIAILGSIAVLTDFVDGLLARHLNAITAAGKILDPLADKMCVLMTALAAMLYMDLPWWLLAIIASRDISILLLGVLIIGRSGKIPVSNLWGKFTAVVLAITLGIYLFRVDQLYLLASILAICFIAISSLSYLGMARRMLSARPIVTQPSSAGEKYRCQID